MVHLANNEELRHISFDSIESYYGQRSQCISKTILEKDVNRMVEAPDIVAEGNFSAAEKCLALLECVINNSKISDQPRREVLGPLEVPIVAPEFDTISENDFLKLIIKTFEFTNSTGYLPGNLRLQNRRVGINQLYHLAASYLQQKSQGVEPVILSPVEINRYPLYSATQATNHIMSSRERPQVDPELNLENITRYTRLMCWTLCRAERNGFS